MTFALSLLAMLALGASAPSAGGAEYEVRPRLNGTIRGWIIDGFDRTPVAFARVSVLGTSISSSSSREGRFELNDVPGGVYTIRVTAEEYRSVERRNVTVAWSTTTDIYFPFVLESCCGPRAPRPSVAASSDSARVAKLLTGTVDPRLDSRSREYFEDVLEPFSMMHTARSRYYFKSVPHVEVAWPEIRESHPGKMRLERASVTWTESWRRRLE